MMNVRTMQFHLLIMNVMLCSMANVCSVCIILLKVLIHTKHYFVGKKCVTFGAYAVIGRVHCSCVLDFAKCFPVVKCCER